MHIPVAVGLVGADGMDLPLKLSSRAKSRDLETDSSTPLRSGRNDTIILDFKKKKQDFKFENVASKPVPSILRNFSAPVKLTTDLTDADLAFLMVNDSDGFNRWEAGQIYAHRVMGGMLSDGSNDVPATFINSVGALIEKAQDASSDKALMARALSLPSLSEIAQKQDVVDPAAISKARDAIQAAIKRDHKAALKDIYTANTFEGEFSVSPDAMGRRALRNTAMGLLTATKGTGCATLATEHYKTADNMTDLMAALGALMPNKNADRDAILADFYDRFNGYLLVMDKWFGIQASADREDIFEQLEALKNHDDFSMTNPNRVRSLYGAFAMNNPVKFHDPSGQGYAFLKNAIIELNTINPQIAARMVTPLREWKRYTPDRQEKMKAALEDILKIDNLSPNVFELVSKSLNG
jgi:aminopeptidase N